MYNQHRRVRTFIVVNSEPKSKEPACTNQNQLFNRQWYIQTSQPLVKMLTSKFSIARSVLIGKLFNTVRKFSGAIPNTINMSKDMLNLTSS